MTAKGLGPVQKISIRNASYSDAADRHYIYTAYADDVRSCEALARRGLVEKCNARKNRYWLTDAGERARRELVDRARALSR